MWCTYVCTGKFKFFSDGMAHPPPVRTRTFERGLLSVFCLSPTRGCRERDQEQRYLLFIFFMSVVWVLLIICVSLSLFVGRRFIGSDGFHLKHQQQLGLLFSCLCIVLYIFLWRRALGARWKQEGFVLRSRSKSRSDPIRHSQCVCVMPFFVR